jgi:hypothetical protein
MSGGGHDDGQRSERLLTRTFEIALLITIAIAGFGQAVLQLWNWLMPELFGLHPFGSGKRSV